MKIRNRILAYILVITSLFNNTISQVKAIEGNNVSKHEGLEIGSILYDFDENGNIIERVIDTEGTYSKEEVLSTNIETSNNMIQTFTISTYDVVKIASDGNEIIVSSHNTLTDATNEYESNIKKDSNSNYGIKYNDTFKKIKYGTVVFKRIEMTNSNGTTYISTTNYTQDVTGASGYLHVDYGVDAAYLETLNNKVKFKISGVIGWVDSSLVDVIPYAEDKTHINFYKVKDGRIYHHIKEKLITDDTYSIVNIGYSPNYLVENQIYYSYDGHYFYDDYFKMINDYRSECYDNSINNDSPYYNYYQFLPLHSKTNYNAYDLNEYLEGKMSANQKKDSVIYKKGEAFIKGLELGVNPIMTLGIAINESGWGTSPIAKNKNNIFGLNAVDADASGSSDTYISVESCVEIFMRQIITHGYLDTKNDSRYNGGHLGDKASGINVSYASDPYWGEKAALFSYSIDDYLGNKDYHYYSLGIKESFDEVKIYKEANKNSNVIYSMKNQNSNLKISYMPVIIISSDTNWYKIFTDHALDENQERIVRISDENLSYKEELAVLYSKNYSFDHSYGYVESKDIYKINDSNLILDGWIKENNKWYFYQNGVALKGWQYISNTWFYFLEDGVMVNQNMMIDGKECLFASNGTWLGYADTKSGWVQENGTWYYYKDGSKITGWFKEGITWYYFNTDGAMHTGWLQLGSTWYYMDANGAMVTGWQQIGSAWYYFNTDGAMHTGWLQIGSTWYYMDSNGAMVTGWQQIGSTWYYFNTDGAMHTGWLQIGNTWYYMDSNGVMVTGSKVIDGRKNVFTSDGAWLGYVDTISGWVQENNTWYYYKDGNIVTGWFKEGTTWYYFNTDGAMHTGWLQLGSTWYYMNASGAMVTGTQVINGAIYKFNSSGEWIA